MSIDPAPNLPETPASIICPRCGIPYDADRRICSHCHLPFSEPLAPARTGWTVREIALWVSRWGAAMLIVGLLLPWATLHSYTSTIQSPVIGFFAGGLYTAALGLCILLFSVIFTQPGVPTAVLGFLAAGLCVYSLQGMSAFYAQTAPDGPEPSYGLYITLASAVICVIGGVVQVFYEPEIIHPPTGGVNPR